MHPNLPEEIRIRTVLFSISIFIIIVVAVFGLLLLTGCQYIPQVADDIEKIADNDAIYISCDKDCFQKDTDVEVSVKVTNKDRTQP